MQISLVITTFNRPDALDVVLESVEHQTKIPFEVIIADDGSNYSTKKMILDFQFKSKLNIKHSFQKNKGFRAARSRNKAISLALGDYIILIDGDMVLHEDFISDHERNAEFGYFIQGTRVLLNQKTSKKIITKQKSDLSFFSRGLSNRKNAIHSVLLSKVFSKNFNTLKGIKSCNVSFFKKDCLSINGFNHEFEGWGREDSEFFIRLMNKGINRKTLRFAAIQFHLWHEEESRKSINKNDLLLENSIANKSVFCQKGINEFYES